MYADQIYQSRFFDPEPVYFWLHGGYFFVKFDSHTGDLWFSCKKAIDTSAVGLEDFEWNSVDWKLVLNSRLMMKIAKHDFYNANFSVCASVSSERDFVTIIDSKVVKF